MASLLRFPGIERTSLPFRAELVRIGDRLSLDPDGMSAVMSQESGYDPAIVNKFTDATGLIQFMPSTAERLGTTVAALRRMGDAEQLTYVEKFYRPFAGRLETPGDFYMAAFMPVHVGKDPGFVIFTEGEIGYVQNAGLDRDHDGRITVGDVTATIEARYAAGRARASLEVDETIPLALAPEGAGGLAAALVSSWLLASLLRSAWCWSAGGGV